VIRDRFVAVFALWPIAAGSLGLASARAVARAIILAIALGSLLASPGAPAQSATEARISPATSRQAAPATPKPAPAPLLDDSADQDAAPTAPTMGETDAEDGSEDGAGEAPVRAAYTAYSGGEPDPEAQVPTPIDGVVLADGTVPVLDGIAVLGTEPRTPEDIAALPAAARRL
jgi:hypothetical protein